MLTMFFMSVSQTVFKKTNMQFHMNLKVRPKPHPKKPTPNNNQRFYFFTHLFND